MSRSGVIDRIDALLASVSSPTFGEVLRGEPMMLSQTPSVAFWLANREVEFLTLGDASSLTEFTIRAYWRLQVSRDIREDVELEVWNAIVNIDTALRGDSDLAGNADNIVIGTASTGYTDMGGVAYRTLEISLSVQIMGEVTITP